MAKEARSNTRHDHLILPCFPSCANCLAWSDDALAFAGGVNVHFLRRKLDAINSLTWSRDSLRIDTSPHQSHFQQNLASVSDFSLGEEQSDPVIVTLAWSSSGLGLHRRSVLAVLTSNLLLAIWETNGVQRGWRRTCILNDYLPDPEADTHIATSSSPYRIRSFAWSHPFLRPAEHKWGSQFLAIADDNNLLFYNVTKESKHEYGQWSITLLCKTRFDSKTHRPRETDGKSILQRVLAQQSPVNSISIGGWQETNTVNEEAKFEARAVISCQRAHTDSTLCFEVTISGDKCTTGTRIVDAANLQELTNGNLFQNGQPAQPTKLGADVLYQLNDESAWRKGLKQSYWDYSTKNNLDGLVRLRFWGYATSPAHDLEAAAITLHPWDEYEYTPPASEKCHIVFRPLPNASLQAKSHIESDGTVLRKVLDYILNQVNAHNFRWNTIDQQIVQTYYTLVSSRADINDPGNILRMVLEKFGTTETSKLLVRAQHTDTSQFAAEVCTMCGSLIEMRSSIASAVCQTGHLFARCNLSLISIQQPRISKHCSGCKKQFIDISKLGSLEGHSLAKNLFDEFDVCPYCGEKYEG